MNALKSNTGNQFITCHAMHEVGVAANVLMSRTVHSAQYPHGVCAVSFRHLSACNDVAGMLCFALPCLLHKISAKRTES